MKVVVNGELRDLDSGDRAHVAVKEITVETLIDLLGLRGRRVAVAINSHVIPRSRFAETTLADGDDVEIIQAVGGG